MDMSPALTGLPETHKPVTPPSVNHYPATLYLVHICQFTGLWNVFSECHWSNSGPIKLRCRATSCAEADRPQRNGIIKSDKWQSTNASWKMKRRLMMWVQLHSHSEAWLMLGFWTQYNNECEGGWRWFYSLFWQASAMCPLLWSNGSCNDTVVSGRLAKSHSVQHRMQLASDSEPQQAGEKGKGRISSFTKVIGSLFDCPS